MTPRWRFRIGRRHRSGARYRASGRAGAPRTRRSVIAGEGGDHDHWPAGPGARARAAATPRMRSAEPTEVPPNFITITAALASRSEQLGVEDGRPGRRRGWCCGPGPRASGRHGASARIASDGNRHPAFPVPVEARLGAVGLGEHVDGPLGRGGKAALLRLARGSRRRPGRPLPAWPCGGCGRRRPCVWPSETATRWTEAEMRNVGVHEGAVDEAPQDLAGLGLDLLLLAAADERDDVVGHVHGGDAGVAGARERLEGHHRDRSGGRRRAREGPGPWRGRRRCSWGWSRCSRRPCACAARPGHRGGRR